MPDRRIIFGVAVVLALGLAGGLWLALSGDDEGPLPGPDPEAPRYELSVDLGRVRGYPVSGKVHGRRLKEPAEAIRRTLTGLYSAGFVDPRLWEGGRFPALYGYFAGDARKEARRDLKELTLGQAAAELTAVRPDRTRLDLQFLVGGPGRPVAAVAHTMEFEGTGLMESGEIPISHEGEYLLRRTRTGWAVTSYDVRGKVPPPEKLRRADFDPGFESRDLLFVLAIGSDARKGQSVSGTRADSLHIIGINPRRGTASIVGIPRDSYVPIPGVGTRKINEALFYGGPELMVRTVEHLSHIHMDAYLLTGFQDFKNMVNSVGGIETRIPYRMSDSYSHAFFKPGPTRLSGTEALAFSRNRHDAPGGDFGRSLNQGRLIIAALQEFKEDLAKDPVALIRWVIAGAQNVRTNLTLEEMVELLQSAASLEPRRVRDRVVSGSGATVGGASVVRLGSAAQATFRDLGRDAWLGGRS